MHFSPGDIIADKFRIVRLLGQGGMGVVYEGENIRIGRRVAIKVLHPDTAADAAATQRFEQEARACAAVRSPHVVEVLDLGDLPDGCHFLVMEYLEGETLGARLDKRGKLSTVETARVAEQVLRGLSALHDVGVVHRDIKPVNLFLVSAPTGEVTKILDFGIAKSLGPPGEGSPRTATGALMGTPNYMSPEQARGLHRSVDARSDLYALGVVLYECLTGRIPFEGENPQVVMFRIALEEPPAIELLVPGVDVAFAALVRRAMARAPENRFPSAREFHDALVAWGRGVPELREIFGGATPPWPATPPVPLDSTPRLQGTPRTPQKGTLPSAGSTAGREPTPSAWGNRSPFPPGPANATAPLAPGPALYRGSAGDGATQRDGARARSAFPRRRSRVATSIVTVVAVSVAGAIAWRQHAQHGPEVELHAAPDAGPAEIVTVTDVPVPATSPVAAADFAAALRIFRDGNTPGAMARLAHAIELEPKLGEAYVQRALMMAADGPVGARGDYLHATELTDTLGPRDAAILKGLGPCVLTEPTDFRACTAALVPLQAQYPHDAEIAFFVASIESMSGDVDISTRLFKSALRLDPKFGFAWARVGQDEAYLGELDEARRSFAECLGVVPTSTFCRMNRLWVSDQEGEIAACENDARALTVTAAQEVAYLEVFPQAIAAEGRPREAVEDALKPALAKWAEAKHYRDGQTVASLDILDGRFDVARASLEALQERYAAHRDPWRWLYLTRSLFALLEEVGDTDAARRLAENLTARLSVLPTNQGAEDWAIAQDPIPLLYEARFRGRAPSPAARAERDAQRDAWIAAWRERTTPAYFGYLWVHAYATYVSTADEAAIAMHALDALGGTIPPYRPQTATNFDIGRTLLLAGEVDRALPYLRKATRSCLPLDFPFSFVRSQLWLGEGLARAGDVAGACAALRTVTSRWGSARPRSATAAAARARAQDLHCP